jgi:regulatory protein
VQKGEDPDQAAEAVAWMEELHLVDDEDTARQVVARCAARGYGLQRAKQSLYEKKIPKCYWESALTDYPDQTETIFAYLRSHLENDSDRKAVKRAVDALLRRGHTYSEIRRAMDRLSLDVDEFPED